MALIEVSFQGTDKAVIDAIDAKAVDLSAAILSKMDELNIETVSWIVENELHGQVLNQRTGKLAGSVRPVSATQSGETITGGVEAGGGPAWYAELFEFGTSVDIYPVHAKALRFETMDGEVVFAKHVHLELPRPFMAPALRARQRDYVAGFEDAINEVLAK